MKAFFSLLVFAAAIILAHPQRAFAADAGEGEMDGEAAMDGEDAADAAVDDDGGAPSNELPFRCGGALCDTTTGGTTCSAAPGLERGGDALPISVVAILALVAFWPLRRRAGRTTEHPR